LPSDFHRTNGISQNLELTLEVLSPDEDPTQEHNPEEQEHRPKD
jgi:hypothetical protein